MCDCISAQEVRRTLAAFPSKIEDVYLQTWPRILGQTPNQASTAINAARPMTIEELECAVAISPDTYNFEHDLLVPGTTLLALCRGLVTLEEDSRIVRLVRKSTDPFLLMPYLISRCDRLHCARYSRRTTP